MTKLMVTNNKTKMRNKMDNVPMINAMTKRVFGFNTLGVMLSTFTWFVRGTEYEYILGGRPACELLFLLGGLCIGIAIGTALIQYELSKLV